MRATAPVRGRPDGPRSDRFAPLVAPTLLVVTFLYTAARSQLCTTDASCTTEVCPADCRRYAELGRWLLVALLTTSTVGWLATRHRRLGPSVMAAMSAVIFLGGLIAMG